MESTPVQIEIVAEAPLPTEHGQFQLSVFRWGPGNTDLGLSPDHLAMTMGELRGGEDVLVRIHSECLTSEAFGSVLCDCRSQLEAAQSLIARAARGAVLYLRQEGRGIGIVNKVRAYQLQSAGQDTVEANRLLGFPDDARDYSAAGAMLQHFGIRSVRLITNNPEKVEALRAMGVVVRAQCALVPASNSHAARYLETKRVRMGHALPPMDLLRQTSS
jgi:GTP cyclohydrolase II